MTHTQLREILAQRGIDGTPPADNRWYIVESPGGNVDILRACPTTLTLLPLAVTRYALLSDAFELPAQRAKMKGDGKAKFLDVWLRELGEDREWLGCAGGPAFGPVGYRNWTPRTLRLNGFQKADVTKLQARQLVVVFRDEDGEPMWVEVASSSSITSDGTLKVDLGYYQTSESGWARFTRFTEETYVKDRGVR